jgi:adenylate kinase
VSEYLARGDLVPDGIVMDTLRKPVETASRNGGYILDGFPRTVAQAESAYLVARELDATVQVALYLEVPRAELLARILARSHEAGRTDDNPSVLEHRLEVFDELTTPLLAYYAAREHLVTVDGAQPVAAVTASAIRALEQVRPGLR